MAHGTSREEAKRKLPNGWHNLIDQIYDLVEKEGCKIMVIKDKCGWLRTLVRGNFGPMAAAKIVSLEQESDSVCMHCGHYGRRRARIAYSIFCEECELAGIEKRHGKTIDPYEET